MAKKDPRKKELIIGRVRELRERLGMTQEKFAESIGISTNTISRIEREQISLTSDVALKIADTHDVSLDWLFFRGKTVISPPL